MFCVNPMSYPYPVSADHPLCGTWSAALPEGNDGSVRTQYTISVVDERFVVTGVDPVDGEEFLVYDVTYDGEYIRFVSRMPSTECTARVWMRVVSKDRVECRWTITETEVWARQPLPLRIVK
jgi:hypothetical protein